MAGAAAGRPVNPEHAALLAVTGWLERLSIAYMVTGSIASSFHGRPRSTHDADIVIAPDARQLEELVRALAMAGYYVDIERARAALRTRRQFNAIEMTSASKLDLIVCKDRPFSREELLRRRPVELLPGQRIYVASPEDTLLSKLEWALRSGGSERQLEDAAGVLALNPDLDHAYVERWARQLGVFELWQRLTDAGPPAE